MKLQEIQPLYEEAKLLNESITDYLKTALETIKKKTPSELFNEDEGGFDLEELARVIVGMRVLSNKSYREAISYEDVGINPNSAREVHDILKSVGKHGDKMTEKTHKFFKSVTSLTPKMLKKELTKLEALKDGDHKARTDVIVELERLASGVEKIYQTIRTIAKQSYLKLAKSL
jgi:hypothetical protein